jgi:hypothetical protein
MMLHLNLRLGIQKLKGLMISVTNSFLIKDIVLPLIEWVDWCIELFIVGAVI